ncbi:hypothetical protein B566_EDAN005181, partial [Ephemera danica]
FFAKYGIEIEKITQNIKGFQNLTFLIRDWKYENDHSFGLEGGNEYFKSRTEMMRMNEELQAVRDTLNHFQKVECFLMPHPGENVSQNPNFKGDIKQVKSIFLDNMKNLVEHLISTVKPKEVLGQVVYGENLTQIMKNYVECLNEGKLPLPRNPIQR